MNISNDVLEIVKIIYQRYGSDSGSLFGVDDRNFVLTIVQIAIGIYQYQETAKAKLGIIISEKK